MLAIEDVLGTGATSNHIFDIHNYQEQVTFHWTRIVDVYTFPAYSDTGQEPCFAGDADIEHNPLLLLPDRYLFLATRFLMSLSE